MFLRKQFFVSWKDIYFQSTHRLFHSVFTKNMNGKIFKKPFGENYLEIFCEHPYLSNGKKHAAFFFKGSLAVRHLFRLWLKRYLKLNPLRANPTKWSNTLTQFVRNLSCLGVFDHFVRLPLKGLIRCILAGKNVFLLNTIPYTFSQLQKRGYKGGFLDGLIVRKKLWIHSNNCSRFPVMRKTKKMMLFRSRHLPAQS